MACCIQGLQSAPSYVACYHRDEKSFIRCYRSYNAVVEQLNIGQVTVVIYTEEWVENRISAYVIH